MYLSFLFINKNSHIDYLMVVRLYEVIITMVGGKIGMQIAVEKHDFFSFVVLNVHKLSQI